MNARMNDDKPENKTYRNLFGIFRIELLIDFVLL